ncbi:putative methyl-accepting chemotaxis sensory transducer [Desulfarculus baarsii DSM 2075]|uniref:Methyl-accepting chemotaxis sensory transducer n=1 Tax=Desulfarculus baarsii (strain ATCC 33931 / DSM 2075 / LMG 7858 / VKM B-1802 / 2st14) TaxID=644282 RepID=E1QJC2_DESB2|nr:HAMP domain-containing protein [Desulfarculus baarsii]ADK85665.1 putative methyl-accepting chemotaxis sensory transducer [Desulfarculus baarsii DSM 2075]
MPNPEQAQNKGQQKYTATQFYQKVALAIIAINACGAALCMFYFMVMDTPAFYQGMQNYPRATLTLAVILITIGLLLTWPWGRKIMICWRAMEACQKPDPKLLASAQRKIINAPLTLSLLTLVNWTVNSLVLAAVRYVDYVPIKGDSGQLGEAGYVLAGVLAAGVVASCVVFFYADHLFRPIRSYFFRGGEILHVQNVFHLSVRTRLVVAFLTGGVFPLLSLVVMVHRKTSQLVQTNPWAIPETVFNMQIFAVVIALALIVFLIFMIERSVSEPLEGIHRAMGKVRDSSEDVPMVPVTSNDELGYLADSFNKMLQGIEILHAVSMNFDLGGADEFNCAPENPDKKQS